MTPHLNITEEGDVKGGKRTGEWRGKFDNITFTETYKGGKLISGKSSNGSGEEKSYTDREILPSFPGGPDSFTAFLAKNIRYPNLDREREIQGRVIMCFDIDIKGKIGNIRIIQTPTEAMANESIRVLRLSPDWVPAKKFGQNVAFKSYVVPITFSLGGDGIKTFH